MYQKIQCITSFASLYVFFFSWTVVYTEISCVYTEVMLPLLVNLAILICLCVDPAKMCFVHPLVATLGNISWVCKEPTVQFLSLCIRAAFSLLRQRRPGVPECPGGAIGEQKTTSIPCWDAPGWAASHGAVHHMSSEGWWHNHTTALHLHPSMPSCHLQLLHFYGTEAKLCRSWLWFIFPGVPLTPKETAAALLRHWHSGQAQVAKIPHQQGR